LTDTNWLPQDCGLNCHEKCRDLVPKACTKGYRDPVEGGAADRFQAAQAGGGPGGHQDSLGYSFPQTQNDTKDSNILHKVA
jgi:hypothetical protein